MMPALPWTFIFIDFGVGCLVKERTLFTGNRIKRMLYAGSGLAFCTFLSQMFLCNGAGCL